MVALIENVRPNVGELKGSSDLQAHLPRISRSNF